VVVNGLYPTIDGLDADPAELAAASDLRIDPAELRAMAAAARFRADRSRLQAEQVARLGTKLPLPQLTLPFLFSSDLGPTDLDHLTAAAIAGIGALDALPDR
jgi:hypothetical protein